MFGFSSDKIQGQVTDLVAQLKTNANLSDEQTKQVVETIKTFVVDKYPMLRGAVESMFGK
jgi:predicted nucleic-acid-binding protein